MCTPLFYGLNLANKKGAVLCCPLIITSVKLFSAVLLVELINTSACIKEHLLAACVERMAL